MRSQQQDRPGVRFTGGESDQEGTSMTTSAEHQPTDLALAEEELVLWWRFDQLHQLGFGEEDACLLAESDADLNRARSLVAAGCPHTVARQILI